MLQAAPLPSLADFVNLLLRRVHEQGRVVARIHGVVDERAHIVLFPHDAGIVADIGNGGDDLGHLEQIGLSLLAGEKALRFQRFQNGDEIDGLGFHHLLAHHPVNGLMLGQIKIIGAQDVRHLVDAFGIHQNSAQNRPHRHGDVQANLEVD